MPGKILRFDPDRRRGGGGEFGMRQASQGAPERKGLSAKEVAERRLDSVLGSFPNVAAQVVRYSSNARNLDYPATVLEAFNDWKESFENCLAGVEAQSPGYLHANTRLAYVGATGELAGIMQANSLLLRRQKARSWLDKWGQGFNIDFTE